MDDPLYAKSSQLPKQIQNRRILGVNIDNWRKLGYKFQYTFSHTVLVSKCPGLCFGGISRLLGFWHRSTEEAWKKSLNSQLYPWAKSLYNESFAPGPGKADVLTVPFLSVERQCVPRLKENARTALTAVLSFLSAAGEHTGWHQQLSPGSTHHFSSVAMHP